MTTRRNPGGDATGLMQSLQAQPENSLLRSDVAERFVRWFVFRVFRAVGDQVRLGSASVEADCGYAARILMGVIRESKYSTDPSWHPAGLAAFIRAEFSDRINPEWGDEEVLTNAMAMLALRCYKAIEAPEDEQEAMVDALVADGVSMLLGVSVTR